MIDVKALLVSFIYTAAAVLVVNLISPHLSDLSFWSESLSVVYRSVVGLLIVIFCVLSLWASNKMEGALFKLFKKKVFISDTMEMLSGGIMFIGVFIGWGIILSQDYAESLFSFVVAIGAMITSICLFTIGVLNNKTKPRFP